MKDTQEILFCPACCKEMVKVKMHEEGIFLDACLDGCGGIYFDNRELAKFDEKVENISDLVRAYEGKTFKAIEIELSRVCPGCGGNFVKNHVSVKKEILIDDCYNCGGKFLDFNELEKMRSQYGNTQERVDDVVDYLYLLKGKELIDTQNTPRKQRSGLNMLFTRLTGLG